MWTLSHSVPSEVFLALQESSSILANIVMPTSVHLPGPLLQAVDRKARALRISRNQLVIRALEREVQEGSDWTPGFFEQLSDSASELVESVDDMLDVIQKGRRSKRPRRL